jgi:hypothetical protein
MRGKARSWTLECLDCEWRRTTLPAGDVLIQGVTHFDACPGCGGGHLMRRKSTEVERLVERIIPQKRQRV